MKAEYLPQVGRNLVKRCDIREPFPIAKEQGIRSSFVGNLDGSKYRSITGET